MLLHHPGAHDVEAYKAMERAVKTENPFDWRIELLHQGNDGFSAQSEYKANTGSERDTSLLSGKGSGKFMHENGIAIEGWYPLGGKGYTAAMLGNETIGQIAKAHGKSPAQII